MFQIFRMIQLVLWHETLLKKNANKIKQRVKLKNIGLAATALNPIIGSPLECLGTVIEIIADKAKVRWDNNRENVYPLSNLIIADFPLKFIPSFAKLNGDNPNVTYKELEYYRLMEREWYEHEERIKARKEGRPTAEVTLTEEESSAIGVVEETPGEIQARQLTMEEIRHMYHGERR